MSSLGHSAGLLRAAVGCYGDGQPIGEEDFRSWFELARSERAIPLLHAMVRLSEHDLTPAQEAAVQAAQVDAMAVAVRLEDELLEVTARLEAADMIVVVVKGAATAHLDYQDPSLRQFGDVDLLVRPSTSHERALCSQPKDGIDLTLCRANMSASSTRSRSEALDDSRSTFINASPTVHSASLSPPIRLSRTVSHTRSLANPFMRFVGRTA